MCFLLNSVNRTLYNDVSELFCGILTHFVFFFNFPPREVEIGIFSDLSQNGACGI